MSVLRRSTAAISKVNIRSIINQSLCGLCQSSMDSGLFYQPPTYQNNAVSPLSNIVCPACARWFDYPKSRCQKCALPLPASTEACGHCLTRHPYFDHVIAGSLYKGPTKALMKGFKQGKLTGLAPLIASLESQIRPYYGDNIQVPLYLCPIPTPFFKWWYRGFNPTHQITQQLVRHLSEWPLHIHWKALTATRKNLGQKHRSLKERLLPKKQRFALGKKHIPSPAPHWVLIDDVMTTGATLSQCAALLKTAGAHQVDAWVLCRTPLAQ